MRSFTCRGWCFFLHTGPPFLHPSEDGHLSQSPYLPKVLWKEQILKPWTLSPQWSLIQEPTESIALTSRPPALSDIQKINKNLSLNSLIFLWFHCYATIKYKLHNLTKKKNLSKFIALPALSTNKKWHNYKVLKDHCTDQVLRQT